MKKLLSIDNPAEVRAISGNPNFTSVELFPGEYNGHKFKAGETRTLTGLVDFPEYNGQTVTITAIRADGPNGKAYYIDGAINAMVNWVYEYRLE